MLTGGNGRAPARARRSTTSSTSRPASATSPPTCRSRTTRATRSAPYLISPDGDTLGLRPEPIGGNNLTSLSAYTRNPVAGTWTLIVDFAEPVVGNEISQPYTGSIRFNTVQVSASGVPNSASTTLPAGTPVTVPVTITNTGIAPEFYFIDPRLNTTQAMTLATQFGTPSSVSLPVVDASPFWLVPSETSSVQVAQTSSLPAMFDYGPQPGDPDLPSANSGSGPLCGTSESASYTPPGGLATAGLWFASPSECGPYAAPAPAGTATVTMTAQTRAFDPAVTSDTGDFWPAGFNDTSTFNPVVINPGQSTTVNVTITPSAPKGSVVSGHLYVDVLETSVAPPAYGQLTSGDELAQVPYSYKVG